MNDSDQSKPTNQIKLERIHFERRVGCCERECEPSVFCVFHRNRALNQMIKIKNKIVLNAACILSMPLHHSHLDIDIDSKTRVEDAINKFKKYINCIID